MRRAIAPLALLGALLFLVAQQHGLIVPADASRYFPWPASSSARATIDVGVTTDPLARNESQPWTPQDLGMVNRFEDVARKHASVIMWYVDWRHRTPLLQQLQAAADRRSVPEITWEPWDSSIRLRVPQPAFRLRNIIDGRFDPYIRAFATTLASWGKPVRLRFAQEMNGSWYPWSELSNRNHRGQFVRAWRHVHNIFRAVGARNVRWVWSPVFGAPREYFPGTRYVDMLGVTCLNGGTIALSYRWRSFATICGASIRSLHRLAPALPVEISELGSAEAGGNKAVWLTRMFAFLARTPAVKSVVFFDIKKEADWAIDSSTGARRAFAAGIGAARYK